MAYLLYRFDYRQCPDGFPQLRVVGDRLHDLRHRWHRRCYGI